MERCVSAIMSECETLAQHSFDTGTRLVAYYYADMQKEASNLQTLSSAKAKGDFGLTSVIVVDVV